MAIARGEARKDLSADALFRALRSQFSSLPDPRSGEVEIPLADALMSAFAMFSLKDPSLLAEKARSYADLPGGHSEGYDDTFKQVFRRFYRTVADPSAPVEYPTFEDGLRQLTILESVLDSSSKHAWVDV